MAVEKLITDHFDTWSSALQTRSTAGRGSNGKIDLYGIKKLRELILELAVRGKLVAHDSNDEPASELLKRIAAEKAELVKQGKIKKQKPVPEIREDEKPFELPIGWEWVTLATIGEIVGGGTPTSNNPHYWCSQGIKWLTPADLNGLQGKYISSGARDITTDGLSNSSAKLMPKGTVLFSSRAPIGYVAISNNELSTNQGFKSCVPYIKESAEYIYYFLLSAAKKIDEMASGTTFKEVSGAVVSKVLLPFPPINEQLKIVQVADKLMSLCDQLEQQSFTRPEAHQQLVETLLATLTESQNAEEFADNWARISQHFDTLFTTEVSIDALKQTILQLAVMGKLVPQDPNDEPASELLKRIEQEKAQLEKEGKIKKQKPLPPVSDDEKPFELPMGWEWCRIGEIIANMDAGWSPACSPEPSPNEDIWGVLKTTAVQRLEYRQQENKTLPSSKLPRPQYEIQDGDILVTRAGPKNRVGISCLVEKTRPRLMISDKIIRFHLISNDISAKYISLCLNCGVTADYLEASKSGMAESQMNISQENLRSAPVALPPAAIQWKVISTIEDFFKVCDQLKSRLQSARQTQLHLADALTDAALN